MKYGYFGKEVKKMMIDKGLTTKDIAENSGVTSAYISAMFCNKKNISNDIIFDISNILSLDREGIKKLHVAAIKDNGFVKFHIQKDDDDYISNIVEKYIFIKDKE